MSTSLSIYTSFLIHLILLALCLSQSSHTVSAFGSNTNNVCDVNTPITVHQTRATGAATRFQLSATSIAPGGSLTVTLSGTIRGFVLYAANAAGAHKGVLTNNANSAACETAPAGSDTGSTIRHRNGNTKQNQQFNWKAPTQPGVYTFYALVTEAGGSAPVYRLPTASVTVQAPAVVTQPPTEPPPVITEPPTEPPPVVIVTQPPPVVDPPEPEVTLPPVIVTQPPPVVDPPQQDPVATLPPPVIIIVTQPPSATNAPITPTDPDTDDTPVIPTTQKPPITGTTTTAPPSSGTGRITPSKGATRPFDAATVALHATPKTDCWTSLNNVVYDISGLFGRHPGQDSTLVGYCGGDCSDIFTSVHSAAAADLAKMEASYRIGVLAVISDKPVATQAPVAGPGKGVTPSAQGGATSTTTKSGMSDSVYIGIIIGGLAALAIIVGGFIYWQKSKVNSTILPK